MAKAKKVKLPLEHNPRNQIITLADVLIRAGYSVGKAFIKSVETLGYDVDEKYEFTFKPRTSLKGVPKQEVINAFNAPIRPTRVTRKRRVGPKK